MPPCLPTAGTEHMAKVEFSHHFKKRVHLRGHLLRGRFLKSLMSRKVNTIFMYDEIKDGEKMEFELTVTPPKIAKECIEFLRAKGFTGQIGYNPNSPQKFWIGSVK